MNKQAWINRVRRITAIALTGAIAVLLLLHTAPGEASARKAVAAGPDDIPDAKKIDAIIGRSGEMNNGVYKIGLPRADLKVRADGVDIKPTLALGSWMAFKRMGGHTLAMGDLVLLESEVNPVLTKLEENGIEISAVHNHILNEQPRVMYMHFMGHGDEEKLAHALKEALSLSGTPMGPPPAAAPAASTTDWKKVQDALGIQGRERGGVLQIGVARKEKIMTADGMEVPGFMGTATAINFQPTEKGAAITGDFVMIASEVNPVIRELRKAGIQITALHSHMLDETPRLFFMHFWANQDAVKLARGLRAALEKTNSAL